MGYSTTFEGVLKFTSPLREDQSEFLGGILGEDWRDHPEWGSVRDCYYIDLSITDDRLGLRWSGAEKTYGMVDAVNLVLRLCRDKWPDFGLSGSMLAQGEDIHDRWVLSISEDGTAKRSDAVFVGASVTCPHCSKSFAVT